MNENGFSRTTFCTHTINMKYCLIHKSSSSRFRIFKKLKTISSENLQCFSMNVFNLLQYFGYAYHFLECAPSTVVVVLDLWLGHVMPVDSMGLHLMLHKKHTYK